MTKAIDKRGDELAALRAENERLREALERIARAEADGLDGARDTVVLKRAIRVARGALREEA